eukprot:scaffold11386_cov129-Isochrysis_galbana.AAC.1
MTDPPIDNTQAREQDAPGTHDAKRPAPVHCPRPHRRPASRQGTLRHTRLGGTYGDYDKWTRSPDESQHRHLERPRARASR